jgi:spore germination protein KB
MLQENNTKEGIFLDKFKLGMKELIALLLISIGSKFTDGTPDLLFGKTYMATWMVPILSAIMIIVPLLLLLKLINSYKMGIVDLTKHLSGKYVGTVLCITLFAISLIGTALLLGNYSKIVGSLYFPQTPTWVFQVLFGLSCFYLALGGAYRVGRTAWIVLPYIKLAIGLLLVLAIFEEWDKSYLFPIFGKGVDVLVKESFMYNSIFIETLLMAAILPYVKKIRDFSKATLLGLVIVVIEMTVFFLFYIMIFDAYSLQSIILPFQHLTRAVDLGRFISNFEGYFLAFWLVASIVKFSFYLLITNMLFVQTFKVKSTHGNIILISITVIVVILGGLPENLIKSLFIYRDYVLNISSILFVLLPVVLWVLSFRKKASVIS